MLLVPLTPFSFQLLGPDHKHPEIRSDVREAKFKKGGGEGAAIIEGKGKMISLSIETKVAIAVVTGFVMFIVGAMVQG